MKIFFMGNNWVGWQTLQWLRDQKAEIVGLAIHPDGMSKYGEEILESASLPEDRVFDGSKLDDPDIIDQVRRLAPDMGVSVYLGYIIRTAFLDIFPRGCINLHPSFLPFNRGVHTNVWSIIEGTPAGATIHLIDSGVDTGAILAQEQVEVEPIDTALSLYQKLEKKCVDLFIQTWPAIREGTITPQPQQPDAGTSHRISDLATIDRLDPDETCTVQEVIDLIRARTFQPYSGVYVESEGRRIELEYGEED